MRHGVGILGTLDPPAIGVPEPHRKLREEMVHLSARLDAAIKDRQGYVMAKSCELSQASDEVRGSFASETTHVIDHRSGAHRHTGIDPEFKEKILEQVAATNRYRDLTQSIEEIETSIDALFDEIEDVVLVEEATHRENIERLYTLLGTSITAGRVADVIGCSKTHVRRYDFDPESGDTAYTDWARKRRDEQVRPNRREDIIARDGGCLRCTEDSPDELEIHHITPVAMGGSADHDNLGTLCTDCHLAAHDAIRDPDCAYDGITGFEVWLGEQ